MSTMREREKGGDRSMKTLLILAAAVVTLLVGEDAIAACSTNTIFGSDGKMTICQICCFGNNCTTNCF
jgi:hypothetical protein